MTETKATAFFALLVSLTFLVSIYLVGKTHDPDFVSPETVEFMYLNKGYSTEEAKEIRETCELKGCSVDENGRILVKP